MSILRTDEEVALNDLLVATRETVDHYYDAIEYLDDEHVAPALRTIIPPRKLFISQLEQAIRALGDLPSVPDPDRETGEMLLHHVSAALSSNTTTEILEQRIKAEHHLLELLQACHDVGLDDRHGQLFNEMEVHIRQTIVDLENLEA